MTPAEVEGASITDFQPGMVYLPSTGKAYSSLDDAMQPIIDLCTFFQTLRAQVTDLSYSDGKISCDMNWVDAQNNPQQMAVVYDMTSESITATSPGSAPVTSASLNDFMMKNQFPNNWFEQMVSSYLSNNYGISDSSLANFQDMGRVGGADRYGFLMPMDTKAGGYKGRVPQHSIPLICDVAADGSVTVYLADPNTWQLVKQLTSAPVASVTDLFDLLPRCFDTSQLEHNLNSRVVAGIQIYSWDVDSTTGKIQFTLDFYAGGRSKASYPITGHIDLVNFFNNPNPLNPDYFLVFDNPAITWDRLLNIYSVFKSITIETGRVPSISGENGFVIGGIDPIVGDKISFEIYLRSEKSHGVAPQYTITADITDPSGAVTVTDLSGNIMPFACVWTWMQTHILEQYDPIHRTIMKYPWIDETSFQSRPDDTFSFMTTPRYDGGKVVEGYQDPETKIVTITNYGGTVMNLQVGSVLAFLECQHEVGR